MLDSTKFADFPFRTKVLSHSSANQIVTFTQETTNEQQCFESAFAKSGALKSLLSHVQSRKKNRGCSEVQRAEL